MIPMGEWVPDRPNFNNAMLEDVINTVPSTDGAWGPVGQALAFTEAATSEPIRGLTFVRKSDGTYDAYAGTETALLKYNTTTQVFDDVSGASAPYNLPENDQWSFALWNTRLIACNQGDPPQYIDIDGVADFLDLPNAPDARFVTVASDRVMFSSLASNNKEIQWSDVNDSENYTTGLSGTNEFPDLGEVMGVYPSAGVVICERGMRRIVPTGDVFSFDFPELFVERGTPAPYSCIELGQNLAFVSEDGFFIGNGAAGFRNISNGRVWDWFYENLNHDKVFAVQGTYDPFFPRLYWAWNSGDEEFNDHFMAWDYGATSQLGEGQWSKIQQNSYSIVRWASGAITLEGGADPSSIDEPGLPSFDSPVYRGGAPVLVIADTDNFLKTLGGNARQAQWVTCLHELNEGMHCRLQDVRFRARGTGVTSSTLEVAAMETEETADEPVFGSAVSMQSGRFPMNAEGRFHKFRFTMPADAVWSHVMGWQPRATPTSEL